MSHLDSDALPPAPKTSLLDKLSSYKPNFSLLSGWQRFLASVDEKDSPLYVMKLYDASNERNMAKAILFLYDSWQTSSSDLDRTPSPSYDIDCLKAQCLAKAYGVDVGVEFSNEPDMSPNGALPFIMLENGKVYDNSQVLAFLKERSHKDGLLASEGPLLLNRQEVLLNMIEIKLRPCLMFSYWMDPEIYEKWTRHLYSRAWPAIIKPYLIWRQKSQVVRDLEKQLQVIDKQKIYADAVSCIESLEVLLNDSAAKSPTAASYLLCTKISELDVSVYAYLFPILDCFPIDHELHIVLSMQSRLSQYLGRLNDIFFPYHART